MRDPRPDWVRPYLSRLGLRDVEPPSFDFLARLQRAHLRHVPWETIDIFAGRPEPIDEKTALRLAAGRRSGYCFHLNAAFAALLSAVGFDARRHRAGVQSHGREPRVDGTHLGLTVNLPQGPVLVDAGLGDMPHDPIPLVRGIYPQGPFVHRLEPSEAAPGGWRLIHDPRGAYVAVDMAPEVVTDLSAFDDAHRYLSTSPCSPWVSRCAVKNRDENGWNSLIGLTLRHTDATGTVSTALQHESEWFDALGDLFEEPLEAYDYTARGQLWMAVVRSHEAWRAAAAGLDTVDGSPGGRGFSTR